MKNSEIRPVVYFGRVIGTIERCGHGTCFWHAEGIDRDAPMILNGFGTLADAKHWLRGRVDPLVPAPPVGLFRGELAPIIPGGGFAEMLEALERMAA